MRAPDLRKPLTETAEFYLITNRAHAVIHHPNAPSLVVGWHSASTEAIATGLMPDPAYVLLLLLMVWATAPELMPHGGVVITENSVKYPRRCGSSAGPYDLLLGASVDHFILTRAALGTLECDPELQIPFPRFALLNGQRRIVF